jgi:hypothetical protein
VSLSFSQHLKLRLLGCVSVGYRVKPGWRAPIEHYAFYCKKHGLVVDYKHGFAGRLECPLCFEEE